MPWVEARSGGISTFAQPRPGKAWWMLPAGTPYPDLLLLNNDHGDHFLWEPAAYMPLEQYLDVLRTLEPLFRRC